MKTVRLTEQDIQDIVNKLITEQEKIYDYGDGYDYKVVNGKWFASKEGANKWFSMDKYPDSVKNLDRKFPQARKNGESKTPTTNTKQKPSEKTTNGKSLNQVQQGAIANAAKNASKKITKTASEIKFNSVEEGNNFRAFVNKYLPDIAKKYNLDKTGKHNNSYIINSASAYVTFKSDWRGFKKGERVMVYNVWINSKKPKETSFIDGVKKTITSFLGYDAAENVAISETGTKLSLSPNASLLFDGEELHWLADGQKIKSWDAESGLTILNTPPSDYDKLINRYIKDKEEWSKDKNAGPIPQGEYSVGPLQTRSGDNQSLGMLETFWYIITGQVEEDKGSNISFNSDTILSKISWGNFRLKITPTGNQDMYNRGSFYVHGGSMSGSHGCIDLTDEMGDFAKFFGVWSSSTNKKTIPLVVKYENSQFVAVINKLTSLF